MNQLVLVEGNRDLRDKFINKTEVLDKVKEIIMLPDGKHIDSNQVAKYYEIDMVTLRSVRHRHKNELDEDGVVTLSGEDLKKLKNEMSLHGATMIARNTTTLFTRRAMLRLGMLLQDSEVAQKVRDYLLDTEETAEVKVGTWTDEEIEIVRNCVIELIGKGKTLRDAYVEAAERMNHTHTVNAISMRYQNKIKKTMPEDVLEKIKDNKNIVNLRHVTTPTIKQQIVSNQEVNSIEKNDMSMLTELKRSLLEQTDLKTKVIELKHELKLKDMLVNDQERAIIKLQEDIRDLVEKQSHLLKQLNSKEATDKKRMTDILKLSRKITEIAKTNNASPDHEIRVGRAYVIKNGIPEFF